ncbi:soluble NSF attachment protein receptor [Tribonema minus]|uniref:Soluble NSF attachment protein receptor n=1 Tax=Tribonema minus TaxID=303371 RepID=A0A836CJ32_9STRA|nr:soluble NSF attachment protein receptor [Tribonema minus]
MTSIFESYHEEFVTLTTDLSRNISHASTYETNPAARSGQLRQANVLLGQADDLLKQMEVEARSTPDAPTRRDLQAKVASYKKSLASVRRDYQTAVEKTERQGLMSTADGLEHLYSQAGASKEHRERLLKTGDKLNEQSEMLANSKRTILEIEGVAGEITTELGRNRETIQSAHGKVREVSAMTANARRLVHNMSKREVQQRFILWGIALLLLLAVILVIYFAVKK